MDFGERLRIARKSKGLTQRQLANLVGAKHNSISNWENGLNMPDPDLIQNLCWVLEVDANYFFGNLDLNQGDNAKHKSECGIIDIYNRLDDHGKAVIDAIARLELERMEGRE